MGDRGTGEKMAAESEETCRPFLCLRQFPRAVAWIAALRQRMQKQRKSRHSSANPATFAAIE